MTGNEGAESTSVDASGPVRVLIVDDHEMFASSLGLALSQEADLEVVGTASSLGQARVMLARDRPDVVLLDQRLPDGKGVDALPSIRAEHPDAQVVMLTADANDSLLVAATEAGCAGFLLKSSALDELVSAVRIAAAGEMLVSRELLGRLLTRMRADRQPPAVDLTAREQEILGLIARGLTNAMIGQQLFISVNTVRNHVQSLLAKLGAHSKLEALSIAVREGLIDSPPDA